MKVLFSIIGTVLAVGIVIYLYQHQLGAISFLLLAIYFFILSYRQLVKKEASDKKSTER